MTGYIMWVSSKRNIDFHISIDGTDVGGRCFLCYWHIVRNFLNKFLKRCPRFLESLAIFDPEYYRSYRGDTHTGNDEFGLVPFDPSYKRHFFSFHE